MKRYIKTYLAAIVFIGTCLSSCIDLDPVDYSEINPSNFPKSEEDLKALVLSCYYPLRGNWWDGIHSPSERGVMFVNDATTEILTDMPIKLAAVRSYWITLKKVHYQTI